MGKKQLARVMSAAVSGIDACRVDVEVHLSKADGALNGPSRVILGLPDASVRESRNRVSSAISNGGYPFPYNDHLTVNLAPADTRKEGPAYDLPIALGILAAQERIDREALEESAVVGELALSGAVRPVRGVLSMAMELARLGVSRFLVPSANAREASVVSDLEVIPIDSIAEAVGWLNGETMIPPAPQEPIIARTNYGDLDYADVRGHDHARRALTIAAAGNHNILMVGPPGSGKTMLARRLPTIMPPLSTEESLETTRIYSVAGLLPTGASLITDRPFRAPHHTISYAGLVGGGAFPRPGEISLAHHGVLFLDELPEFSRRTLEVLRQPMEERRVTLSRAATSLTYPANVLFAGSMNPCPCGFHGDPKHRCTCTGGKVNRYRSRVSGPLLDRIDLHLEIPAIPWRELAAKGPTDTSARMAERVVEARLRQLRRFDGNPYRTNASMSERERRTYCGLNDAADRLLNVAVERLGLSARACTRILKVARTIADLECCDELQAEHVAEAVQYRGNEERAK